MLIPEPLWAVLGSGPEGPEDVPGDPTRLRAGTRVEEEEGSSAQHQQQ